MGVKIFMRLCGALLSLIVLKIWKTFQNMFERPIESLIQFLYLFNTLGSTRPKIF